MLMEAHKIHVDRRQGMFFCFVFLTLQNNTRRPQQNEMLRDRWGGRSWGCHKLIHCGLIHSLVTLSPNVSEQFYTLPWYAGSQSRLHSRESERQGHHWLPLRAECGTLFPQRCLAVTAGSDKHEPGRISTTDESEIGPRGELSCANSNCQMTTGCSSWESALW